MASQAFIIEQEAAIIAGRQGGSLAAAQNAAREAREALALEDAQRAGSSSNRNCWGTLHANAVAIQSRIGQHPDWFTGAAECLEELDRLMRQFGGRFGR